MNLAGIVRSAIGSVNPLIEATWLQSVKGYTTLDDGTQVPKYAGGVQTCLQVQPMSSTDLQKIDGMNIQGTKRSVYIEDPRVAGAIRADQRGGDLLVFSEYPNSAPRTWLCVMALETWPNWCKIAVVLQKDQHV